MWKIYYQLPDDKLIRTLKCDTKVKADNLCDLCRGRGATIRKVVQVKDDNKKEGDE